MQHTKSGVGIHGAHRIITCSQCKQSIDIRYMTSGSTMCNKCTKKMNRTSLSEKSISNGNDENHDYDEEIDADDSLSRIGEKRAREEAGLNVDEDDLRAYNQLPQPASTGTEDVMMVDTSASKGIQQQ